CVKGGRVTVDLRNDGPTMLGANASFTARLRFPGGQCASSEGDVAWPSMAKNTGARLMEEQGGASVYPELGEQGLNDAYVPPGGRRRRRFVYVWSTRGQQWQEFGHASSKFSLSSDNFALGSYTMVLVVYHHRKSMQYIPIAKASTTYSITDQIPVTVEMRQAQDRRPGDNRFVTGASIDFTANIHDPRRFLAQADLTYTWDFGDESGTLIAHVSSATHDYTVPGTYLPRLVVQATIPRPCPLTQSPTTIGPRTFPSSPSQGSPSIITASSDIITPFNPTSQQPALDTTVINDLSTPEVSVMTEVLSSVFPTTNSLSSLSPNTLDPSSEGDNITVLSTITGMVSSMSASPTDSSGSSSPDTVEPTNDDATTMSPSKSGEISMSTMGVATSGNTTDSGTINPNSTSIMTTAAVPTYNAASLEPLTEASFSTATFDNEITTFATTMNNTDFVTTMAPAALVLVKRQAPENSECPIYLYGTYRASIDVIEGITVVDLESSFTVVQAANEQSASLNFTVMCNGSIPTEVCMTVADKDCSSPHRQWCRPLPRQADCAIHLQELFNSPGNYCLNVTLGNSQSLALASTEVFVQRGTVTF
uniref:melanocyte protein PMEL-like n=1 Tax=Myxine glutinosa TaxID=7769 RepID=UPI00358E5E72